MLISMEFGKLGLVYLISSIMVTLSGWELQGLWGLLPVHVGWEAAATISLLSPVHISKNKEAGWTCDHSVTGQQSMWVSQFASIFLGESCQRNRYCDRFSMQYQQILQAFTCNRCQIFSTVERKWRLCATLTRNSNAFREALLLATILSRFNGSICGPAECGIAW